MVHLLFIALALLISSPNPMTKTNKHAAGSAAPSLHRRSARISASKSKATNDHTDEETHPPKKVKLSTVAKPTSSKAPSLTIQQKKSKSDEANNTMMMMPPLLNLGKLVRGTVVKRPSATIRSPYVADVSLFKGGKKKKSVSSSETETVLAHAPSLDVGGMCVAGSEVYMTKRNPGGKTSHAIELVRGDPLLPSTSIASDNKNKSAKQGVLVGAHPRLGELIAEEVLKRGLLADALPLQKDGFKLGPVNDFESKKKSSPKKQSAKKQKPDDGIESSKQAKPEAAAAATESTNDSYSTPKINLQQQVTLGDSRVDFQMTITHPHSNTSHQIIFEVKNVVCADYKAGTEPVPMGPGHCVVVAPPTKNDNGQDDEYKRSALFPWGKTRGQKFEGKSVVSERACKHLRNLQSLRSKDVTTVVLFVVNRSDCDSVRACHEKCPVFAEVLADVVKGGVKALAVRVSWTEDGECLFDGVVPVVV